MSPSFPNINDLESVKSLLEQLSASQAWQEVANAQTNVPPVQPSTPAENNGVSNPPADSTPEVSTGTTVAALLSQLQAPPAVPPEPVAPPTDVDAIAEKAEETYTAPGYDSYAVQYEDVRSYSFQKALPYIASLAESSAFVTKVRQLKIDQDRLEKQLYEERQAIFKKYEEKVNVAKNKAKLIGTGISKHEADTIRDNLKKELDRFDRERALPSWDGLIAKQQTALESLGIPQMFPTGDKATRERQQRIVQVLEGVIGSEDG